MKAIWTVVSAIVTSSAIAADPAPGMAKFNQFCSECHASGFGHPGTQQLGWSRGQGLAVLEMRKDLSSAYVAMVVRNGLVEMPPFRPSEIDDAALSSIVRYLVSAKTSAKRKS